LQKINQFSFFSSLLIHFIAFSGIWLYFDFSSPTVVSASSEISYIRSYLYTREYSQKIPLAKKPIQLLFKTATTQSTSTSQSQNTSPLNNSSNTHHSVTNHSAAPQSKHPAAITELLTSLHQAIQNKQQYPASALQMKRQGRVNIAFKLYPNGTISHLRIQKSSGTVSLDQAAITAVRLAAPFSEINHYLHTPEDFTIDVVFALSEESD